MRQSFQTLLSAPSSDVVSLYFWVFLFHLNFYTINNRTVYRFCWDLIKCELFYIDGGCKNSGYCCNHLKIKYDNTVIQTKTQFFQMSHKFPVLKRFVPNLTHDQEGIRSFSCSSLSANNYCNDYSTRPNFCRNYPYNVFLEYDYIRDGCGYKVKLKREFKSYNNQLQKLIRKVYLLNAL